MAHNRPERAIPIDPLPSNQEPPFRIIAPNLDRVSRDTFKRGSVERRRAIRGIIVLVVVIAAVVVVAIVGTLVSIIR